MKDYLLFIIFFLLVACSGSEKNTPKVENQTNNNAAVINEAKQLLQPGDLLLRSGTSYASEQIKKLSEIDQTYSHAGVVVLEDSNLKVCSIEPIDDGSNFDKIRYDPIDTFLNPKYNSGFGIYRYTLSAKEKEKMLLKIEQYHTQNIEFDPIFNYNTDNKLYCSELINKSLVYATDGRVNIKKTYITNPLKINSIIRHFRKYKIDENYIKTMPIITVDNVYLDTACKMIRQYTFIK